MPQPSADFEGLLRTFAEQDARFVVIGGVSAALQGVPAVTYDLDLVLGQEAENLDRTLSILRGLESCNREHLPRRLEPQRDDLDAEGAMLLMTRLGPLALVPPHSPRARRLMSEVAP